MNESKVTAGYAFGHPILEKCETSTNEHQLLINPQINLANHDFVF